MKKILYLFLITSIIFTSCSKEEDSASIVGIWSPESIETNMTITTVLLGQTMGTIDSTVTITPNDPQWEGLGGDLEFTTGGQYIVDGEIDGTYTFEDGELTMIDNDGDADTNPCTVTATTLTMTYTDQDVEGDINNGLITDYVFTITANRK